MEVRKTSASPVALVRLPLRPGAAAKVVEVLRRHWPGWDQGAGAARRAMVARTLRDWLGPSSAG